MESPLPLLTGEKEWTINEEAVQIISREKRPLVIVTVVGKYRTGKSYLLNMMHDTEAPFPLGNTVQSQTKGVWFYIQDHPEDPNKALLLLDTEGLFDVEKEDTSHDLELFVLVVLMTSVLIYNTMGTIDSQSLEGLRVATALTDKIKTSDDGSSCEFGRFFPTLVWAVRDQYLQLAINGKEVTPDQYLEHCLKLNPKKSEDYNELRQSIRDYFHERKCFVFPRPVRDEEQLSQLAKISKHQLQDKFVKATDDFLWYIFKEGPQKICDGQAWTGSVFVTFLHLYAESIRKGSVDIPSAYESMSKIENEKAYTNGIQKYRDDMPLEHSLPMEEHKLKQIHAESIDNATSLFFEQSAGRKSRVEFSEKLLDDIADIFNGIIANNDKKSMENCTALLNNLYLPIEQKCQNGDFAISGGYQDFKGMMEELEHQYNENTEQRRGPKKDAALMEFLLSKEVFGQSILVADNRLTEAEKKEFEERERARLLDQKREEDEKEMKRMQLKQAEQDKMDQDKLAELVKTMEREHLQRIAEMEKDNQKKIQEAQRLLSEKFHKEAEKMQTRISATEGQLTEMKSQTKNKNSVVKFIQKATRKAFGIFKKK